ncbi:MAG TPA: zeta toxin family protein [Thermoanaerobaculia bacterium]|nr:zeta toxin family protein [Thermoanaerobaculia bacterium]
MASKAVAPVIFVLAGVNGAGKSSLGGVLLRGSGLAYFNPDEAARRIKEKTRCTADEANSLAWQEGVKMLQVAIDRRRSYAFETTLGGRTIPGLLVEASTAGIEVLVWYVGLSSPEQHIARVRSRVASGGHDIPEAMIRSRWDLSRRNLIALLPHLAELQVFDNSETGDPAAGTIPEPRLVMRWRRGRVVAPSAKRLRQTPDWAKPIVVAALRLERTTGES